MNAAALASREPTKGFSPIPNSLIENQSILTRAELALALIVLRRGASDVPVSDRNWNAWTGLTPRMKEKAEAGLRLKCLRVTGRGDRARYSFDSRSWESFVRTVDRGVKPRTEGRSVDPKPGAKIHPECRERGCALLRHETGETGLTPDDSSSNAKRVSQIGESCGDPSKPGSRGGNTLIPFPAPSNAKRVSQTAEVWAKSLAALQAIFPLITEVFLVRLIAVTKAVFGAFSDDELAASIHFAWEQRRAVQKTEGLFLATVPAALGAIRRSGGLVREGLSPGRDRYGAEGIAESVRALLARVAASLRAHPVPAFGVLAAELDRLQNGVNDALARGDFESVESEMGRIEAEILKTAAATLTAEQTAAIDDAANSELKPYVGRMTGQQLASHRLQASERLTLSILAIPRLTFC